MVGPVAAMAPAALVFQPTGSAAVVEGKAFVRTGDAVDCAMAMPGMIDQSVTNNVTAIIDDVPRCCSSSRYGFNAPSSH